jgi:hypothetical protein
MRFVLTACGVAAIWMVGLFLGAALHALPLALVACVALTWALALQVRQATPTR